MRLRALQLLCLCACGSVTDPSYRGDPLVTLKGRLTLGPGLTLEKPIRLAVVWSSVASDGSRVSSATDEVEYQNNFPLPFELPLYAPPADQVLMSPDGGTGRLAQGQLVAYEDLDGNGRLSLAGPGESVRDRVLGISGASPTDQSTFNRDGLYVAYVEAPLPGEAIALGFPVGFSLARVSPTGVVTLVSGSVFELELRDNSLLAGAICADAFAQPPPEAPCGIRQPEYFVDANVAIWSNGLGIARITVNTFSGGPITNARVTLNDVPVPLSMETFSGYYLVEATRSSVRFGSNRIRVEVPMQPPVEKDVFVPHAMTITAPPIVKAGSTFTLSWTPSEGAARYEVVPNGVPLDGVVSGLTFTGTAPSTAGRLELVVLATTLPPSIGEYRGLVSLEVVP